jgi:hypothetical protein
LIKIASPDHNLVGIANVIERCNLTARELFTILMEQHLLFELRTVSASLGAQAVDAMHAVGLIQVRILDSDTDHRRASSIAPPSPAKKLLTTLSLNSVSHFFIKPLEVCLTSGGQFSGRAVQNFKQASSIFPHNP